MDPLDAARIKGPTGTWLRHGADRYLAEAR
jgi:hypothetical protein